MSFNRNKLYSFLIISCLAGYIWLLINYNIRFINDKTEMGVCLFKQITNIPCPSCGSTRAIQFLLKGELLDSILLNPVGLLLLLIMIVTPIWIMYDLITKNDSFLRIYRRMEINLSKRSIAIPSIIFVLLNWIWNIYKGL